MNRGGRGGRGRGFQGGRGFGGRGFGGRGGGFRGRGRGGGFGGYDQGEPDQVIGKNILHSLVRTGEEGNINQFVNPIPPRSLLDQKFLNT